MGGDRQAFEHQVRITSHEHPVFERRRLALGRVADDVARAYALIANGRPLSPGWKPRAAASTQAAFRHGFDHVGRRHRQRQLQRGTSARGDVLVQGRAVLEKVQNGDVPHTWERARVPGLPNYASRRERFRTSSAHAAISESGSSSYAKLSS